MTAAVLAGAFVFGALVTAMIWMLVAEIFGHPSLVRTNVHGRPVPTAGGLAIVLAALVGVAVVRLDRVLEFDVLSDEVFIPWSPILVVVLGFGFLGFVDDLLGDSSSRGFRGHLASMATGRLTTGGLKLVGGGVVALVAVLQTQVYNGRLGWLAVDVALVALAANLANLLDRAPGRVTKVAVLLTVALVAFAPWEPALSLPLLVSPVATVFMVGAAVGLLVPELREQLMLGDTGANVVGAALGIGAVQALGDSARVAIVVVLLVLNIASERVSFSRVIATTPGLRQLDQWGRPSS